MPDTIDMHRDAHPLDTPHKVIDYLRFCSAREAHAGIKPNECKTLVDYFDQLVAANKTLSIALAEVEG